MALEQFDRKYKLTIGSPNATGASTNKKSVVLQDNHIEFDIKNTADSKQNTLELKIFNLSQETIAIFDVKDVLVTLEVAYGDAPYVIIFRGDKASMKTERQETEVITTVIAAEGYVASREGRLQAAVGEGSTVKDVINKIIKEGFPEIKVINISPDVTTKVYNKGYSISGGAKKALDDVCNANNLMWNIEKNETINVFPKKGDIKVKAFVLTPQNGLISTPEKTSQEVRNLKDDLDVPPDAGIKFQCLLNPLLKAGSLVQIRGTFNSDGDYRMDSISHRGGYESDEWTTTVEAVRLT